MKIETMITILGSIFIICVTVGVLFSEPSNTNMTEEEKRVSVYSACQHTCINVKPRQECINKCLNYANK